MDPMGSRGLGVPQIAWFGGIVLFVEDITAQKLTEERLQQAASVFIPFLSVSMEVSHFI
jgi:hypothetical protein